MTRLAWLAVLVLVLALLGAGAWLGYRLRSERDAAASLAREAEASRLEAQGQVVAVQAAAEAIEAELDAVLGNNDELRVALEAARRAAGKVRVVRIVEASTAPAPARASVATGDELQARVVDVTLRTESGNELVVGTVEVLRLPDVLVLRQPFDARLSRVMAAPEPAPAQGWPWYVHEAIGLGVGLVLGVVIAR